MRQPLTLLLLLLILAGCGSSDGVVATPTPTPSASPFAPPTTTAGADHHWQVGDVVETDTWEMRITQTKEVPAQSTPTLVSLLIEVAMNNMTASAQEAKSLSFTLHDQQGKAYDSSRSLPDGYPALAGTIASHSQTQGWLGFEVPPDQHQFTLTFADTTHTFVWDISIFTDARMKEVREDRLASF